MTITMRRLHTSEELEQMERLQEAVWGSQLIIPTNFTSILGKFGGLFAGAFDGDQMIGFLYSFPGFHNHQFYLCSHMLGFLPAYRKQGLGVQMKWLQKAEAARAGYTQVSWTFDPLETVNANLNITKLGGIVRTYLPNCYGERNDSFNHSLPTDRFLCEWLITSKRVETYQKGEAVKRTNVDPSIPQVLRYEVTGEPITRPLSWDNTCEDELLAVAVPAFFQEIKEADLGLAREWRAITGQVFMHYFAQGYIVTDLVREKNKPVVTYILQKGVDIQ